MHMFKSYTITNRWMWLQCLFTISAVACSANLFFKWQDVVQGRQIEQRRSAYAQLLMHRLGDRIPPLVEFDILGRHTAINFSSVEKTLLFVFSEKCPACETNWPTWERIRASSSGSGVRTVFLSIAPAGVSSSFVASKRLAPADLLVEIDPMTKIHLGLSTTPQTILVGPQGVPKGLWTGVLWPDTEAAITKLIDAN